MTATVKAADLPVGSEVGDNWVCWTKRQADEWTSQHGTVYTDQQVQLRLDDDATVLTFGEPAPRDAIDDAEFNEALRTAREGQ